MQKVRKLHTKERTLSPLGFDRIILIFHIMCLFFPSVLFPQENNDKVIETPEAGEKKDSKQDAKPEKNIKNINVDATLLYGQYNTIFWSGSIVQNLDRFTYQLNSRFKRSNDFGYKNSGYYDNEFGFIGDAEITDKWKLTPDVAVDNESHGMFRNIFYNREEKDRVTLRIKNEYKPMPTRWEVGVGFSYFLHRLDSNLYPLPDALWRYHSSDLYRINAELGWEYIWSAANKLRFTSKFFNYFYSTGSDYDTAVANELIWNFNLSEYFKFSLGPLYTYNRDGGHFASGKIDVVTSNLKYLSIGASYVYDLVPFTPEVYYFEQRYVRPNYSLHPSKGHHVGLNIGFDYSSTGEDIFYIKKATFKISGFYVTNDRYYTLFSLPELILLPHQMRLMQCKIKAECGIGFALYSSYLELGGKYEYVYSYASDNVTYQPDHAASGYVIFNIWRFEIQFSTGFRSAMYADPFINIRITKALTGSAALQFRILDSFYIYGRIDNIYNSKYSTRYGYPEQGRTVVGGLRIII